MTKKEELLVRQIEERVEKAFKHKQDWTDQARDNISKFMNDNWRKNKKKDGFVSIPLIYWAVKTKLARDLEPLFIPEDLVEIKPVEENDDEKAELNQHLLNWQLKNTPDIKIKFWMLHLQKRICGTSPYMIVQDYKKKKVRRYQKPSWWQRLLGSQGKEIVETKIKSYPNLELIDFFDFFIEPGAKTISTAAYCGRKFKIKLNELKKKKDKYINLKELEKKLNSSNSNTTSSQEEGGVERAQLSDDEKVPEVIEYWTDEKQVMVSNGVLIMNRDNPYWHEEKPFGALINDPELNKFYGRGDPELGECLNDLYNRTRKARIVNLELISDKIMMVKEGSGEKTNKWKVKPGAKWKVKKFENVKEFSFSDIKHSSRDELGLSQAEFERIMFVSGYQTGAASPDINDTATGVSIISFESNKIFSLHKQLDETLGIERIADLYLKLNVQFMRTPKVVRIAGDQGYKWVKISPDDVLNDYDLYPTGSSRMPNKQAYLQQLLKMYQLFVNDPDINKYEFKKKIFDAAELRGKDKLLIKRDDQQMLLPGMEGAQENNLVKQPAEIPNTMSEKDMLANSDGRSINQVNQSMGGMPRSG